MLTTFSLAVVAGYQSVWGVKPALHTPLMSGSNFVSGLVIIGAMIALATATNPLEQALGFIGVLMAAANAVGGYAATDRMLEMFKKKEKK